MKMSEKKSVGVLNGLKNNVNRPIEEKPKEKAPEKEEKLINRSYYFTKESIQQLNELKVFLCDGKSYSEIICEAIDYYYKHKKGE